MAAKSARVIPLNETQFIDVPGKEGWTICLQWCIYSYNDGTNKHGYRFIWRKPDGKLQAARGQARIPNLSIVSQLMAQANEEGWGELSDNSPKDDNR